MIPSGTGCTSGTVVTVNPTPSAVTVSGGGTFCGSATLTASGGGGATIYFEGTNSLSTSTATPSTSMAVNATGTYYFVAQTAAGCWSTPASATVLIPGITGVNRICQGTSATLANTDGAGTWTSSNTAVATVGSTTGTVTGVSSGTSIISNTLGSGCLVTSVVTISPSAPAITGPTVVCLGQTIALGNAGAGGTWSTSAPTIAIVGSTGIVTGIASGAGNATITNTLGATCKSTVSVSVTALSIITGTTSVCVGQTTALLNGTGGGTWSSSATGTATVGTTGIVSGVSAGSAVISYSLPSGCIATAPVSVILLSSITGSSIVCVGQTTTLTDLTGGGTWNSSSPTIATIGAANGVVTGVAGGLSTVMTYTLGSGCKATTTITVNALAAIAGLGSVCQGSTIALTDAASGGTWSSSGTSIATIGTSGVLTGVGPGIVTISYQMPTGCLATTRVFVNPVAAITGPSTVCFGQTMTLADAAGAGTWSSSAPTIATIGSTSGIVTGIAANLSANITYTFCSGCKVYSTITVNPLSAISGATTLCQTQSIALTDGTSGGTWSSSNIGIATVGTAGVVSGVGSGQVTISYILPSGCTAVQTETVNPLSSITGPNKVCAGQTISLSDATSGGIWVSSTPTVATIGSTGVVTGIAANLTTTISYTMASGCRATLVVSVAPIPSAPATIGGASSVSISGSTITLTDATTGGTWTSSNLARATVGSSSGVVTGVGLGTVIITYTVANASGCTSYITKNITVDPVPPPHSVTAKTVSINFGASLTLNETLKGGSWTCNDCEGIVSLNTEAGTITGIGQGRAIITYTVNDDSGTSLSITKVVVNALPESVITLTKEGSVYLVPNPNKGVFTVKGNLATSNDEEITIEVVDILGQTVFKGITKANEGKINEQVILSNTLPNGMYLMNLHSNAEYYVFHFVVER